MTPSFIIVNKVVNDNKNQLSAQPEGIRLDHVKSYRKWNKTDAEMIAFKEDITIVYMNDKEEKENKTTAIKVAESFKNFHERVTSIRAINSEVVKEVKAV